MRFTFQSSLHFPLHTVCAPCRMRGALVDLRRKLLDGDQYAMCHCLELLDFIMKNCSSDIHEEILSAEFLAVVKTVVTVGWVV